MPDPILVGRNAEKVAALARQYGIERWTTDLDAALANPDDTVFFDAATTQMRADLLTRAIEAGKHIYCEKPVADSLDKALRGGQARARSAASSTASSRTSCSCPGLRKIRMLRDSGFFGRMFAVRGEFGYWVFEGDWGSRRSGRAGTTRRPKAAASSSTCCATGATCSTTCSGAVQAVSCLGANHIPEARRRERPDAIRPTSTMPPTPPSSSKAASSRT